jgi:glycine hydroxymethyltransferase
MNLAHGGHLTHGHPRSFSGQLYEAVSYGVDRETGLIDYEQVRRLAEQHNPALIIVGSSSYSRTIDFAQFGAIAEDLGAFLMADIAHIAGLIAAGVHPSPVPHADFITGTTHKTLRGPRGGFILSRQKHAHAIDGAVMPGIQGGPMMHVIAAKAVCFKLAGTPEFKQYQRQVVANARAMADELAGQGFSIVSGGTDNHMFMVDLTRNGLSGIEAQNVLARANITLNKNVIPYDTRKPSEGSGIRIGTPAVTTRGLKEEEVRQVARWIAEVLLARDPATAADALKPQALDLCARFPIP